MPGRQDNISVLPTPEMVFQSFWLCAKAAQITTISTQLMLWHSHWQQSDKPNLAAIRLIVSLQIAWSAYVADANVRNETNALQQQADCWCRLQVQPWVVDVSTDVKQCPALNEVTYHGYYQGQSPQPTGQPGFIMMESNLVFYMPSRQISVQAVSTV